MFFRRYLRCKILSGVYASLESTDDLVSMTVYAGFTRRVQYGVNRVFKLVQWN